jgi:hypothetical protein
VLLNVVTPIEVLTGKRSCCTPASAQYSHTCSYIQTINYERNVKGGAIGRRGGDRERGKEKNADLLCPAFSTPRIQHCTCT